MARKFSELRKKMPPAAQAKAEALAREQLKLMPLYELRQARQISQQTLATVLRVNQASISKLENRADMYVSSLRSYVEAMGGQLEIVAHFPQGSVRIKTFEEIDDAR